MSRRSSASLSAVLAAVALAACPKAPEDKPSPKVRGVKVPLIDGWTARVGPDQSLIVGPAGRAVLRLDQRPGQAKAKPSAQDLVAAYTKTTDGGDVPARTKDEGPVSWAVIGAPEPFLLGAKVAGDDLFLCSTAPGSSAQEVEAAVRACEGLEYAASP